MTTLTEPHETSSVDLRQVAQLSPSGLALVANLPKTSKQPEISESRWFHAPHVDYLDDLLVRLVRGDLAKEGYIGLIIEEPPRHGKSELCSHYFPSWYLGTFPQNRVILSSYEADFAMSWGRKVRNTVSEWGHVFGVEVSKSSARLRWLSIISAPAVG